MMPLTFLLLALVNYPQPARAQEEAPVTPPDRYLVSINLAEACHAQPNLCESGDGENKYSFRFKDQKDIDWVIKFRFGFTRAVFAPTDVELSTPDAHVTIKGFHFVERTSANAYNPQDWIKVGNPLEWIDEPSNMADINLEIGDGKNVFFLTSTHPKRIKSDAAGTNFVEGTIGTTAVAKNMDLNSSDYSDPSNLHMIRFDDTYRQLDIQVGYGRKFKLARFGKKRNGSLNYTPHAHVGITTGAADLITATASPDQSTEHNESAFLQGWNVSLGHLLELETKRVTFFVDQKFTYSKLHTQLNDGYVNYDLKYMQIGFGVGVKIFRVRPHLSHDVTNSIAN